MWMCADRKGENLTQRAQHEPRRGDKVASESTKARSCPVMLAVGLGKRIPGERGAWSSILKGPNAMLRHKVSLVLFYKQAGEIL